MFCKEILSIWLVNVPDYAVVITQLVIITSFTEALSAPLWTAIGATGKVQKYQLLVSLIIFLNVPLVYVAFKLGMSPIAAFVINFVVSVFAYLYRLLYIKKYVPYHLGDYLKKVVLPCVIVTVLSFPIPYIFRGYTISIISTIFLLILTVVVTGIVILLIGLDMNEKQFLISKIKKVIKKK